jgi:hypothetical protein
MTKITLALAAAILAGTTVSNAANAGGVRLGFGFPLGSFVAHSTQKYSQGGGSAYRHNNKYDRRTVSRDHQQPKKRAHRKVEVAESERKVTKPQKPANTVKTAKLEKPNVTSDAPAVVAPDSSTGQTAAITPAPEAIKVVKVDTPKLDNAEQIEREASKIHDNGKRVCRKFSAAVNGLVDVPCE